MKDYLRDIVKNTLVLGPETVVKVIGESEEKTKIKARREDNTIILKATIREEVKDFQGVFGLSKLPMLQSLISLPYFKAKDAEITVKKETKNDVEMPTEIRFKGQNGAAASYRFTHEAAIPKQISDKEIDFEVELSQPSKSKISEFAQLSTVYAGVEETFGIKTQDNNLVFLIGNEHSSSHKASFTFAEGVQGRLTPGYVWSIADFLGVLKLTEGAESVIKFRNEFIKVDIDTGLCKYEFILPGTN